MINASTKKLDKKENRPVAKLMIRYWDNEMWRTQIQQQIWSDQNYNWKFMLKENNLDES